LPRSRRTSLLPAPRPWRLAAAAVAIAAWLLAASPSRAEEPNLLISSGLWRAKISGEGETGSGGAAEGFDWDSTLGLDTEESVPAFEAILRFTHSRFILGLEHGDYEGETTLSDDLEFAGATFPQGGDLESKMSFSRRRLLYGRPIVEGKRLGIGLVLGLDSYKVETKLTMPQPAGPGSQEMDVQSKVPVLGATISFYPTARVRIYGELTGMSIERGGVDSRLITAFGVAEYAIVGDFLAISLGYRYSTLHGRDEAEEAEVDLDQHGAYTGLTLRL